MKIVHIAGVRIRVGNRERQLCAWCGRVLIDNDYECMAAAPNEDGSAWEPAFWEVTALVAVDGNASWVMKRVDGDRLPSESCVHRMSLSEPQLLVEN